MRLRCVLIAIIAIIVGAIIIAIILYLAYQFNLIDLKDFMTWMMSGVVIEVVAGIIGYLLGRKEKAKELAKAIAEESQKLKEKEEATKKHIEVIHHQIIRLLGVSSHFEVQLGDFLSCLDAEKFPFTEELSSHLEAYNALSIIKTAKQLCQDFNTDLKRAIDETIKEFIKLVESQEFSLQRYDSIRHPDRYYSPDILVWDIYRKRLEPYIIEPHDRDGWWKIGNTIAQTDNKAELELFTKLANEFSVKKREVFEKFYDRKQEAIGKIKEFFDAIREIKKKLDSGHPLEGQCYLCPK